MGQSSTYPPNKRIVQRCLPFISTDRARPLPKLWLKVPSSVISATSAIPMQSNTWPILASPVRRANDCPATWQSELGQAFARCRHRAEFVRVAGEDLGPLPATIRGIELAQALGAQEQT